MEPPTLRALLLLSLLPLGAALPDPVAAHGVDHVVTTAEATVVEVRYADGSPFAHQPCEVRREGEERPFLVTPTDAEGRLVFLPPDTGTYEVRVLSHDGHGATISIDVAALASGVPSAGRSSPGPGRTVQLLVGTALILGLFLALGRWFRRGTPADGPAS